MIPPDAHLAPGPRYALEHPSTWNRQEPPSPTSSNSKGFALSLLTKSLARRLICGDTSREKVVELFRLAYPRATSFHEIALAANKDFGFGVSTVERVLRKKQDMKSSQLLALQAFVGADRVSKWLFGVEE